MTGQNAVKEVYFEVYRLLFHVTLCWANFRGLGKKVGNLGLECIKSLPLTKDGEMLEKVQEYCKVLSNQNFK